MVEKLNNQSNIDRHYLKAMGIDLWVDRKVEIHSDSTVASSPNAMPSTAPVPAVASNPGAHKTLVECSASELSEAVAGLSVSCSEPVKPAEIIVITEDLTLSDQCANLLDAMFKAIEFDRTQWLHAGISNAKDAIPISHLEASVKPKALILMLKTGGSETALQNVRYVQHKVQTLNAFMLTSFHPQDLLDNPATKRPAWEDLKKLRQWLL